MSNQILLLAKGPAENGQAGRADVETIKVEWNAAVYPVADAIGKRCPSVVFANEGDYGYGRFLLDRASEAATEALFDPHSQPRGEADAGLAASVADATAALRRTMLWGALWDDVHVARSAPRGYVELALKSLAEESDESLVRIQGARIATALHAYLHETARESLTPRAEAVIAERMLKAPTPGLRIVSFRTFTAVAESPAALGQVKELLAGKLVVPGLTLKPLDRWNLVGHLIAMGDPEAEAIAAAERARDHSGEGQKYAYAVGAGAASAAVKARYFDEYLHSQTIEEDWITQSLRPFNSWNQTALTEPYLTKALDELPEIKQHRKIFFLGAWLEVFIEGQNSAQAQATVHAWLAQQTIDPDLRLKVLEVSDSLDRTVLIRQKFAE
jgi:aminopeptidase N